MFGKFDKSQIILYEQYNFFRLFGKLSNLSILLQEQSSSIILE